MQTFNICFHGIGRPQRELEPDEDRYWISEDMYARVLDEISGRSDVRLSFDDGNVSDIAVGLPGLLKRNMAATFFMLAGRLESPGSLAEDHLRELLARGMTVGSHGMDHKPWRGMSDASLDRELVDARDMLASATGSRVTEAALPLGRYDRRVVRRLRDLGYTAVFTSDRRPARAGSWMQPRYSVRADDTIESVRSAMLTTPAFGSRLRLEAIGLIKRLR